MGLLNDVLDFTKSRAGKIKLNIGGCDLRALIDTYTKTWAPAAEEKNINFTVSSGADLPAIARLDELRTIQILNNIVSNAIKFSEVGTVSTSFGVRNDTETGTCLQISISDTGIGMTTDHIKRLFTPFEQADNSITRRFGGTGLGMAITKDLITLMKGTINCDSRVGEGTTFHLSIPIEVPTKQNTGNDNLKIRDILIVDDVEMNLMVGEGLIEKLGHRAIKASNAKEAIALAAENTYDLILMDVHMPEVNGIEAARQIKTIKPNQKIIALSADDPQTISDIDLDEVIDGFLVKPMNVNSLADILQNCD